MAEIYYHLPILIILISLVYSGTRFDRWDAILHEAVRWGLRTCPKPRTFEARIPGWRGL